MEVIKNKRILALVGIICLFIGTITPYFKFSFLGYSYTISLWKYWEGKVIVALIVANAMFIFKDYLQKYVPQIFNSSMGQKIENANPKLSIVPTILVVAFVVYLTAHLDVASEYLKHGLGFYALWIGVVGLVGHVIFYKKQTQQDQSIQQAVQQPMNNQPQNNYQQPMDNQSQNVKYCPKCGNKVDSNATTCFMCGNNF